MKSHNLEGYIDLLPDYSELRAQENASVQIRVLNGSVSTNTCNTTSGVSARTFNKGCWGFSSIPVFDDESIRNVIRTASVNSRFLAEREQKETVHLPSRPGRISKDYSTKAKKFSRSDVIDFMMMIDARIDEKYSDVVARTSVLSLLDMEKSLITSDGSISYSMMPRTSIYISMATEYKGEPIELGHNIRSAPQQLEDAIPDKEDVFEKLDLLFDHLMKKAEGVYARTGLQECILDADIGGILSHEAIGHTTEADLVRGGSVAGDYLGQQVASPLVTLVDFASEALGEICPAPVYIDDEGVLAEDAVLIENGILKGYMHNKETAVLFGATPTGNARAYAYCDEPIIRMRNTAILPGKSCLKDMIASVDDGYYLMKSSNGQADSTGEFMFGVIQGYEIRNGKLGRAIRNTTISGVAFDLLRSVTAVSNDMNWRCGWCGKKTGIPVGMGGPAVKCLVCIGGK